MRKDDQVEDQQAGQGEDEREEGAFGPAVQSYLEMSGQTVEQVNAQLKQLEAIMRLMPVEMDSLMLGYFIEGLFDRYGVSGSGRIELLARLVEMTKGASVRVARAERNEDGDLELKSAAGEPIPECDCPKCRAERRSLAH